MSNLQEKQKLKNTAARLIRLVSIKISSEYSELNIDSICYGIRWTRYRYYSELMQWLSSIVIEDLCEMTDLMKIYEEIRANHFLAWFGDDRILKCVWAEFCNDVANEVELPLTLGLDSLPEIKEFGQYEYEELGMTLGIHTIIT